MKILIDTRIWALAIKSPFMKVQDPDYEIASKAKEIVENPIGLWKSEGK